MIKVSTTLTPADVAHVTGNMRPADKKEIFATMWDESMQSACTIALNAPGWKCCVYVDDEPVAIGGAVPVMPGVVQLWGWATPKVSKARVTITRLLYKVLAKCPAHRIQAAVHEDNHHALLWLNRAGMVHMAPMNGMGKAGENFVMMAEVRSVGS